MLYPSVLCGCCFILNIFIMAKGSSGAVSTLQCLYRFDVVNLLLLTLSFYQCIARYWDCMVSVCPSVLL